MQYFQLLLGFVCLFALAFLMSKNRSAVRLRFLVQIVVVEFLVAYFLLNTTYGTLFTNSLAGGFTTLLGYAFKGTEFVFGGLINDGKFCFFLNVLMSIVLVSALIGILQYTKILPMFIKGFGLVMSKINGMGRIESFNAVGAVLVGQSENFITYKDVIDQFSERRLFTMAVTCMSTVSMSIVGSYMQILEPKYIVTALFLNMFSAFAMTSIVNPYTPEDEPSLEEMYSTVEAETRNVTFFEVLSEYIVTGFTVAVLVGAMLVGYIALIQMVNGITTNICGVSFQDILGYLFCPVAWLMGVDAHDALKAGSIIATKIVSNEFVAMMDLKAITSSLSAHTVAVVSVFLVSFANLSSIGIIAGAVRGISSKQGDVVASFGLRLLVTATTVSFLSAMVVSSLI